MEILNNVTFVALIVPACKVLIVHALCCSNVNTSPCSQKMEEVQSSLSLLYRRYGIRFNTFAAVIIKAVVEKVQFKMSVLLVHSWDQHPAEK